MLEVPASLPGVQLKTAGHAGSQWLPLAPFLLVSPPYSTCHLQLMSLTLGALPPRLAPAEPGQGWRGMGHFRELSSSCLPGGLFSFLSSNVHKENLGPCKGRLFSSKTAPLCVQQAEGGGVPVWPALAGHPGEGSGVTAESQVWGGPWAPVVPSPGHRAVTAQVGKLRL